MAGAGSQASSSETKTKEVMIIEDNDPTVQRMWETFVVEDAEKVVNWDSGLANDVRNAGFADTHATDNRQRSSDDELSVAQKKSQTERRQKSEPFDVFQGQELLSEGVDPLLTFCGVPDTACRRTLVGESTLRSIEGVLSEQGLKVKRAKIPNQLACEESVLQAIVGVINSEESVVACESLRTPLCDQGGSFTRRKRNSTSFEQGVVAAIRSSVGHVS